MKGARTSETELTPAEYRSLAAFRHALRRFMHFSAEAAQAEGLTTQQHQALLAIKGFEGAGRITVGGLAEQLLVAPHTAAELVARLAEAGLAAKVADPADRRRVSVVLTRRSDTVLRALTLVHLREVRGLAPGLMTILRDLEGEAAAPPS